MINVKKIIIFINSLTSGGAERVAVTLAGYLASRNYEVSVVTIHGVETDFYPIDSRVRRIALGMRGRHKGIGKIFANLDRLLALRRTIRVEQAQVVVGMMTVSAVLATLASAWLPVRVVVSERNYPGMKRVPIGWALLRRLVYRFADAHVAQTQRAAEWIKRHTGARNIRVVPNSVAWPVPSCPPEMDPSTIIAPGRQVVLAVGTKLEQKGFDLLLDAYERVADDFPTWDLVILGLESVSDRERLRVLARAAGLEARLHLLGRVGNVAAWYERANIFVLSSRYEGFPNVLLEAMASGCACVAFDCDTGPREVIQSGINGFLVPAGNTEALGRAMRELMADEDQRVQLGRAAKRVREKFAEEVVLARWESLIQKLAADTSSSDM